MSCWLTACQSNKTGVITASEPILKATDDVQAARGGNLKKKKLCVAGLSHHPRLWWLACLECIKTRPEWLSSRDAMSATWVPSDSFPMTRLRV